MANIALYKLEKPNPDSEISVSKVSPMDEIEISTLPEKIQVTHNIQTTDKLNYDEILPS